MLPFVHRAGLSVLALVDPTVPQHHWIDLQSVLELIPVEDRVPCCLWVATDELVVADGRSVRVVGVLDPLDAVRRGRTLDGARQLHARSLHDGYVERQAGRVKDVASGCGSLGSTGSLVRQLLSQRI